MPQAKKEKKKTVAKKPTKSTKAAKVAKPAKTTKKAAERYFEAVGRRKTATARIRIVDNSKKEFVVNEKSLADYFQEQEQQIVAKEAFEKGFPKGAYSVSALVRGGGKNAQAEAVRQGISRALIKSEEDLRPQLKTLGFLKRDSRMRERKKFGLKRARRARQWRKR